MKKKKKIPQKLANEVFWELKLHHRERESGYILTDLWKMKASEWGLKGCIFWFRNVLAIFSKYGLWNFPSLKVWLSEEFLQTAEKKWEAKDKGEKEKYTHLNAEFQRIARRDKKGFLSDQCKEIEENNRMGKTRDLFKKTRDTKVKFHAKMGTIKDRNSLDLTEAEDIKKRWKNTQKNSTKKIFMTQIITIVWSLT